MIGSTLGYFLVRLSVYSDHISKPKSFCMNLPGLDDGKAFVVEFLISFILILIVCAVWDPRNAKFHGKCKIKKFV